MKISIAQKSCLKKSNLLPREEWEELAEESKEKAAEKHGLLALLKALQRAAREGQQQRAGLNLKFTLHRSKKYGKSIRPVPTKTVYGILAILHCVILGGEYSQIC